MLITPKDAAKLMGVSARTIRRQVAAGELKGHRVGRQIRLPLDQFSDFIDVEKVREEIKKRADKAGVNR